MSLGNLHQYTLELPILLDYLKGESQVRVSANKLAVNVVVAIAQTQFQKAYKNKQSKSVKAEKQVHMVFSQLRSKI